jgi:hypothetical protein
VREKSCVGQIEEGEFSKMGVNLAIARPRIDTVKYINSN